MTVLLLLFVAVTRSAHPVGRVGVWAPNPLSALSPRDLTSPVFALDSSLLQAKSRDSNGRWARVGEGLDVVGPRFTH